MQSGQENLRRSQASRQPAWKAWPQRSTVVGVTAELRLGGHQRGTGGVTVVDMSRQHAGYAAGLRAGDVLLAVNGEPCATPEHASGLLRAEARLPPA